jgi:uncharacterized membrane protein YbhN (UPF0104 family)
MVAFAFGAGIVLDTAPSRATAGPVNRALLDAVDTFSIVAAAVLLASSFFLSQVTKLERGILLRLLLLALAAALISRFVITPRLSALRDLMPLSMDLVPKESPTRQAWGRLHAVSTLALLVRILCAAALFFVTYRVRDGERNLVSPSEEAVPSEK